MFNSTFAQLTLHPTNGSFSIDPNTSSNGRNIPTNGSKSPLKPFHVSEDASKELSGVWIFSEIYTVSPAVSKFSSFVEVVELPIYARVTCQEVRVHIPKRSKGGEKRKLALTPAQMTINLQTHPRWRVWTIRDTLCTPFEWEGQRVKTWMTWMYGNGRSDAVRGVEVRNCST